MEELFRQKVFDKGTHFPYIYLFFMLKRWVHFCRRWKGPRKLQECQLLSNAELLVRTTGKRSEYPLGKLGKMGKSECLGGLGFRDLKSFNKALLEKQYWRIFQNLESLAVKIIKVKYFPLGSIFDAKLGNRLSYVWRSMCEHLGIF